MSEDSKITIKSFLVLSFAMLIAMFVPRARIAMGYIGKDFARGIQRIGVQIKIGDKWRTLASVKDTTIKSILGR